MKKKLFVYICFLSLPFWTACSEDSDPSSAKTEEEVSSASEDIDEEESSSSTSDENLADYAPAIRMNKMLGHGINFGNSWDASCSNNLISSGNCLDNGWNHPIQDEWFQIVKDAGFQSIRIPVRWNQTALNEPPYTVQKERVEGVREDVKIANSLGMPAIINIHHYNELYDDPDGQKEKFYAMWEQIAEAFKDFSNDSLVFEVLNESRGQSDKQLAELTNKAIQIIRKSNPKRTIMVNPGNYGKFELMGKLDLPKDDGNIILSGHYYEPFSYSHQGHNSSCGNVWDENDNQRAATIVKDLKSYVAMAKAVYPGKNGTYMPLNMGEFGASSKCAAEGADEANRATYLESIISVANELGITWHVWGFTGVDFDTYNYNWATGEGEWYPTIIKTLQKYL